MKDLAADERGGGRCEDSREEGDGKRFDQGSYRRPMSEDEASTSQREDDSVTAKFKEAHLDVSGAALAEVLVESEVGTGVVGVQVSTVRA
jgi:hypothetical protein